MNGIGQIVCILEFTGQIMGLFSKKPCETCEELRRQVIYLQGLVERALAMTVPVALPEEPEEAETEKENVVERIKFGDG